MVLEAAPAPPPPPFFFLGGGLPGRWPSLVEVESQPTLPLAGPAFPRSPRPNVVVPAPRSAPVPIHFSPLTVVFAYPHDPFPFVCVWRRPCIRNALP